MIDLEKIEELLVVKRMTITDACKQLKIDESSFYKHLKKLDDKTFAQLFARAREARGLRLLDDCLENYEKMKKADNKEAWHLKNVIDQGLRLAAVCNKNLAERPLVQNNTQTINNYHDDFVMKKLERSKNE